MNERLTVMESTSHPTEKPSGVLRTEHQVILRVIESLSRLVDRSERGEGFEVAAFRRCVEFFRLFADACHHAKEEDLLFPVMESRGIPREGGPIGVMLEEHTMARGFTRAMHEALEAFEGGDAEGEARFCGAARQYQELLTHHIHKEDNILFMMADRVMTSDDQDSLCSQFCEVGCRTFGGKKREELERIADELEQ